MWAPVHPECPCGQWALSRAQLVQTHPRDRVISSSGDSSTRPEGFMCSRGQLHTCAHPVTLVLSLLQGGRSSLGSSSGQDNKEKKIFISLVGTRGLGCRWVARVPWGSLMASGPRWAPTPLPVSLLLPRRLLSTSGDTSWCMISSLSFTTAL